jgi:hypothetical protein
MTEAEPLAVAAIYAEEIAPGHATLAERPGGCEKLRLKVERGLKTWRFTHETGPSRGRFCRLHI